MPEDRENSLKIVYKRFTIQLSCDIMPINLRCKGEYIYEIRKRDPRYRRIFSKWR